MLPAHRVPTYLIGSEQRNEVERAPFRIFKTSQKLDGTVMQSFDNPLISD